MAKGNQVKPNTSAASATGGMKNTGRGGAREAKSASMPKQRVSAAGNKGTNRPSLGTSPGSPWGTKDGGASKAMPQGAVKAPSNTRAGQGKANSPGASAC